MSRRKMILMANRIVIPTMTGTRLGEEGRRSYHDLNARIAPENGLKASMERQIVVTVGFVFGAVRWGGFRTLEEIRS
jgi:hypothetical protein